MRIATTSARGGSLHRLLVAFLIALSLIGILPAAAQDEGGSGTITGKVLNARTGRYMNQAQITVLDTGRQTFTNQFGEYEIYGLPPGEYELEASFTGMENQTARVRVDSGQDAFQDFTFARRQGEETRSQDGDIFEMEEFVVDASDFQTMQELAIQEERFSTNLKNVVSADAYGAVAQGNIGEFVKFIPGVQVDYGGAYSSGADATQIRIRGYEADQTAITIDGIPVANAQPGQLTEAVGLDMLSINNASRVEVIKVPTPDQPAASIAGTVNLISKTAFEYPEPQLSYRLYFTINSENTEFFKKTPGPTNKPTYKTLPGVDLTYALPLNEKIGFTFTLATSNSFNENHRIKPSWRTRRDTEINEWVGADGTVISPVYADATRPVLDNLSISDNPRFSFRNSAAIKMDWRPFEGFVVTTNYSYSDFSSESGERLAEMNAAGNFDLDSYGPDFHIGKDGQGNHQLIVRSLDREGESHNAYLKLSYIKGPWDVRAHVSWSQSDGNLLSGANGHFSEIETAMGGIFKTSFLDIVDNVPQERTFLDEEGFELNPNSLASYTISGYDPDDPQASTLAVRAGESRSKDEVNTAKFDVRRDLDFIPLEFVKIAVKAGVYREEKTKSKSGLGINYKYQYIGESGVSIDLNDFLDENYIGVDPGFGFDPYEWPDPYKMYDYYLEHQNAFSDTNDVPRFAIPSNPNQPPSTTPEEISVAANNYNEYVNTNYSITEENMSWYWQVETNWFTNRLTVVGGVRSSQKERSGRAKFSDPDWMRLRTGRDENGDGLLDLFPFPPPDDIPPEEQDFWPPPSLNEPMLEATAQYWESQGATYADGTPFQAGVAYDGTQMVQREIFPGLPFYELHYPDTNIGVRNQGYIVNGSLAAAQLASQANFPVNEKAITSPSPMISASFDLTDSIILRASWAQTSAAKNIEDTILRDVRYDTDSSPPRAIVNNKELEPWKADSYDFGVSYYTQSGGKFSVSYFIKEESDFHENVSFIVTEDDLDSLPNYGLPPDPSFLGWVIETQRNGEGTATSTGYELEFSQSMGGLGNFWEPLRKWLEPFYVYASYTNKERTQDVVEGTSIITPVGPSSDETLAGGVNFRYKRFNARVNATWRSEQVRGGGVVRVLIDPTMPSGDDNYTEVAAFTLVPDELKVDVNLSYRISDKLSIDFTAKNITNTSRETYFMTVDDTYPAYAQLNERQVFGVSYTIGLSGQW